MATSQELAERLIPLLEEQGLRAVLGQPVQYGHKITITLGEVSGRVVLYLNKKGKLSKNMEPPSLNVNQGIVTRVDAAWVALTGSVRLAQSEQVNPAGVVRPHPLTTYLNSLNQIADACEAVTTAVDWVPLTHELAWIANECGASSPISDIRSLEDWRCQSNRIADRIATAHG